MKKKIEELFRLAMKAQEKTSAYVSFETSNHGWGCVVMIMDDGFEVKHGYDGWYEMDMFYSDERSEEQYQKAKEHLIRLLRKKRKWQKTISSVWLLKAVFAICSGTVQTQESRKNSIKSLRREDFTMSSGTIGILLVIT